MFHSGVLNQKTIELKQLIKVLQKAKDKLNDRKQKTRKILQKIQSGQFERK
jgi:hypothetical protein